MNFSDVQKFSFSLIWNPDDRKTLVHIPPPAEYPAGVLGNAAMDINGGIWVNSYNGTSIYHIDTG